VSHGRAHVLVGTELRRRLYEESGLRGALTILEDSPFGGGLHQLGGVSEKLPPGYHGQMDVIVAGGEVRLKEDCDV
jgi:hypothetical protein